jgi:hypothetical protein
MPLKLQVLIYRRFHEHWTFLNGLFRTQTVGDETNPTVVTEQFGDLLSCLSVAIVADEVLESVIGNWQHYVIIRSLFLGSVLP